MAPYAVTLEKREVDLAYLYVQTAPSTYENVAALAGCAYEWRVTNAPCRTMRAIAACSITASSIAR